MRQRLGFFAQDHAVHPRVWHQELQAAGTLMSAERMLTDAGLPELLSESYLGHRESLVFVQRVACMSWQLGR